MKLYLLGKFQDRYCSDQNTKSINLYPNRCQPISWIFHALALHVLAEWFEQHVTTKWNCANLISKSISSHKNFCWISCFHNQRLLGWLLEWKTDSKGILYNFADFYRILTIYMLNYGKSYKGGNSIRKHLLQMLNLNYDILLQVYISLHCCFFKT